MSKPDGGPAAEFTISGGTYVQLDKPMAFLSGTAKTIVCGLFVGEGTTLRFEGNMMMLLADAKPKKKRAK